MACNVPLRIGFPDDIEGLDFDGSRNFRLDVKDIFIEYAAQQDINFAGSLNENAVLVKEDVALLIFDNGHCKQLPLAFAKREPVADRKRTVGQLILMDEHAFSFRIVKGNLSGADVGS